MKRSHILITALAATAALGLPASASAAFTASTDGTNGTLTGDDAADTVVIEDDGGNLSHGITAAPFASATDWDTTAADTQAVPSATATVTLSGGGGDDNLGFDPNLAIVAAILDGGAGNDLLTGSRLADGLNGGDGNDRLVGFRGGDNMLGGNGNDTLVWNNGDGSDTMDGEGGNDAVEVNGAPTAGDVFTVKPNGARIDFDRTNLGPFSLDIGTTERMEINGLGGADTMTVDNGLGALLLTLAGGAGPDTITGGDTHELILGGEDADTLDGRGGDDRVVGDRGGDTMAGGGGDDTLVWNNGDGSDTMNGEDGLDAIEVNGSVAANDVFTIAPNADRAKFDRVSPGPFTLDIGTAELLDLNMLGGDDTFTASNGTPLASVVNGGAGNDTITGADGPDTLSGGGGNDTITGGGGLDALDGQSGDDRLEARDGAADLVRCGSGTDTAIADQANVDALDSCETADRLPVQASPVAQATLERVTIRRRRGRQQLSFRVSCAGARCAARLQVMTRRRVRVRRVLTHLLLAERRITLEAGQTQTFRLTLPRRAERVAKRRLRVRMTFAGTVTTRNLRTR